MIFSSERGPSDEAEDHAIDAWREKTGDPPKIAPDVNRTYVRVWLSCPGCGHRQAEWIAPGAATRVMRCRGCETTVWTRCPQ